MDKQFTSLIDHIVKNEFQDDFDLYNFEKEQLFDTLENKKEAVKLNEFGITVGEAPAYIIAITSLVNLLIRVKHHRKKIVKEDLKNEFEINKLPEEVTDVLLKKYAEILIEQINKRTS